MFLTFFINPRIYLFPLRIKDGNCKKYTYHMIGKVVLRWIRAFWLVLKLIGRGAYDKLLTYLACSSHAGEYWSSVILVGTSLSSVRAATTSGQYSTVRPPSLVSKKLLCMAKDETKEICEDPETNVFVVKWEKKRSLPSQLRQYLHFHHSNPKSKKASNFSSQYHHWITRSDHENKGNNHQLKKLLILKQILLTSILGNVRRTVWRICILMLAFKG